MALGDFVKVEKNGANGREIHLVHRSDPYFTVEMEPLVHPDGRVRGGILRRIRLRNAWAREYHRYGKYLSEAELFFRQSLAAEAEVDRIRYR